MSATADVTSATGPLTARSILIESGLTDLGRRLSDARVLDDVASHLVASGSSLWEGAHGQLTSLANDFLDVDIATVMVNGWRRHRELLDAAARTQQTRESAVVPLATRNLSLVQHPSVDLILGDVTLTTVRFELRVEVDAIALAGVVRGGALVALTSGTCNVTVSFSANGVSLAKATRRVEPHLTVSLGSGILLTHSAQRSPHGYESSDGDAADA